MKKTINIGIIGVGKISDLHIKGYKNMINIDEYKVNSIFDFALFFKPIILEALTLAILITNKSPGNK